MFQLSIKAEYLTHLTSRLSSYHSRCLAVCCDTTDGRIRRLHRTTLGSCLWGYCYHGLLLLCICSMQLQEEQAHGRLERGFARHCGRINDGHGLLWIFKLTIVSSAFYRFPSLLAPKGCRILERRPMISKFVLNMTKQLPNLIAYVVM